MFPFNMRQISRRTWAQILVGSILAIITIVGVLKMVQPEQAIVWVRKGGYWGMAATCILVPWLCWADLRVIVTRVGSYIRTYRWSMLIILLCVLHTHLHEPHRMKILFDEGAIASTAMTMHKAREASVTGQAHLIGSELYLMANYPDKRPYFYAFLVSLFHDLTGFWTGNPFMVNGLAGALFLLGLFAWGTSFGSERIGITLVLLYSGLPLFAQNVTSANLETLNLAMILVFAWAARLYLRSPGIGGLNLLILSGVFLAQTRYESGLFLILIPLLWILKSWREREISLNWFAALSPVLVAPALFVQRIFHDNRSFWQLDDPSQAVFGPEYFHDNLGRAVHFFSSLDFTMANAPLVSIFALVGGLSGGVLIFRHRARNDQLIIWALLSMIVVSNFTLLMFYYWGQLDDPIVSRLALPLILAGILGLPGLLVDAWKSASIPKWIPILCAVHLVMFTTASNVRHLSTNCFSNSTTLEFALNQLRARPPTERNFVCSYSSPTYIAQGFPSGSSENLLFKLESVPWMLEEGIYDNVMLVQLYKVDFVTGKESENAKIPLDQFFEKEVLSEQWIEPSLIARFSRVTGLKPFSPEQREEWMQMYRERNDRPDLEIRGWDWPDEGFDSERSFAYEWMRRLP